MPLGSAPLGLVSLESAPLGLMFLGSAPLGLVPLGVVSLGSAPSESGPLGSMPLGSAPLGLISLGLMPLGSAPLRLVPLGSAHSGSTLALYSAPAGRRRLVLPSFNNPSSSLGRIKQTSGFVQLGELCAGGARPAASRGLLQPKLCSRIPLTLRNDALRGHKGCSEGSKSGASSSTLSTPHLSREPPLGVVLLLWYGMKPPACGNSRRKTTILSYTIEPPALVVPEQNKRMDRQTEPLVCQSCVFCGCVVTSIPFAEALCADWEGNEAHIHTCVTSVEKRNEWGHGSCAAGLPCCVWEGMCRLLGFYWWIFLRGGFAVNTSEKSSRPTRKKPIPIRKRGLRPQQTAASSGERCVPQNGLTGSRRVAASADHHRSHSARRWSRTEEEAAAVLGRGWACWLWPC